MNKDDKQDYENTLSEVFRSAGDIKRFRGNKPTHTKKGKPPFCSFCGYGQDQVEAMIEGPGVFICNVCIEVCKELSELQKSS